MNIKNFLILLFSILTMSFSAQIKDPVKFQLKINELGNNLYEAVLIANLEKNWHIYSKDIPEDSGIPTEMILSGKNIEVMGKVTEIILTKFLLCKNSNLKILLKLQILL